MDADRLTVPSIGIVGGGPSGLLLALALARRGVPSTIFERDTHPDLAPRFHPDRSYTIDLTGHGAKALRHVDVEAYFDERLLPFRGLVYFGEREEWKGPGWTGSRGDILRALAAAIRDRHASAVELLHGTPVERVDVRTGEVTARRDGRVASRTFDLLVGADGAGSIVRAALEEQVEGFTTTRRSDPNHCRMLELDRVGDRLDREVLHGLSARPFCVAGAIRGDAGPASTRWFCAVGTKGERTYASLAEAKAWFASRTPVVLEFASDAALEAFVRRPSYHIGKSVSCSQLHGGRAVLLGDAAAAFPPIGQGANAALESAMGLDLALAAAVSTREALLAGAAAYSRAWKPELDAVAWLARASLFENRFHLLRLALTRRLGVNPFALAKHAEIPWTEIRRRMRRFWPLWR